MKNKIVSSVRSLIKQTDLCLTKNSKIAELRNGQISQLDLDFFNSLDPHTLKKCIQLFLESKSQLRQDLFVLSELDFKTNGFFVEFGATNGIDLSNTYLLEKKFGWNGILAEPAKIWHDELKLNRKSCIDHECVWKESGQQLVFNETENAEFSTISKFSDHDKHSKNRKYTQKYSVDTVSLCDLLKRHNAPKQIDYLSIDTEGSEFDILNNFDFDQYSFSVITCEHNFTENRDLIYELLTSNGYARKLTHVSTFDDWYVKTNTPCD